MLKLKYSDVEPSFTLRMSVNSGFPMAELRGHFSSDIKDQLKEADFNSVLLAAGDWHDLSPLIEHKSLYDLTIRYDSVNWTDVPKLKHLKRLWSCNGFSKIPYGECKSLKKLACNGKDKYIEQVFDMVELESLFIRGFKGTDLTPFSKLTNLKKLELVDAKKLQSLQGVEKLTSLTLLELNGKPKLTDISALNQARQLKMLDLEGCKHINWPQSLAGLQDIRCLRLLQTSQLDSIATFADCTELAFILNFGVHVKEGDLSSICQLNNLKQLIFDQKRHYNVDLDAISQQLEEQYGKWPDISSEPWYNLKEWYL